MRQTQPPPCLSESYSDASPSHPTVTIHHTDRRQVLSRTLRPGPKGRTDSSLSAGLPARVWSSLSRWWRRLLSPPPPQEQFRGGI